MQPENDSFQGDLLLFVVTHVSEPFFHPPFLCFVFCCFVPLHSLPAMGASPFVFVLSVACLHTRDERPVMCLFPPVCLYFCVQSSMPVCVCPTSVAVFLFVLFLPCWSYVRVADREECTLPCCVALFRLVFLIYVCSWDWFAGVPCCAVFSSPRGARRDGSLPSLCKQVTSILTATGKFLSRSSAR